MLKADLHIHTKEDPYDTINYSAKELIDLAIKKNYDIIAITLHNKLFWDNDLYSYANKRGLLLIPGAEIEINKKHVLIYPKNINFDIKKIRTFSDLKKYKKEFGLIIAPHPFFKTKQCLGKYLIKYIELFDAIEYSHFYTKLFNLNKKAVKIAKKYKKPLIGNSDSHFKFQFEITYTLIDAKKNKKAINRNDIYKLIKEDKVIVKTKPLNLLLFIKIILSHLFSRKLFKQQNK